MNDIHSKKYLISFEFYLRDLTERGLIAIFKEADAEALSTRNASLECATARCASRHEISVNSRAGSWENSVETQFRVCCV